MTKENFRVTITTLTHSGEKKFYHAILIENNVRNAAICVFRWGKIGAFGSMMVEKGKRDEIDAIFARKLHDKKKRDYDCIKTEDYERVLEVDLVDLKAIIGNQFYKLGKENLFHLSPAIDTVGVNSANATIGEDFRKIEKTPRMVEEDEEVLEASENARLIMERAAKLKAESGYRVNKNWGSF